MTRILGWLLAGALVAPALAGGDERPKADAQFKREGDAKRREKLDPMEWKAPRSELKTESWVKGEVTTFAKLRGKVVLVDFWGTW